VNKNNKGFAHLFILVVLALVIFGGIGYYAYKNGQLKLIPSENQAIVSPTPTTGVDETENWKTYTNEEVGFEFKYPSNWQVVLPTNTSFTISNLYFDPALDGTTPLPNQVFLKFNLTHASLENYSSEKHEYVSTEGVMVIEQGRYINSSESLGIISLYRSNDPNIPIYERTISQILSTFKFLEFTVSKPCEFESFPTYIEGKLSSCNPIDKISIFGWMKYKIYDNQQDYGITFKYPESFIIKDSSQDPEHLSVELDSEGGIEKNSPIISLVTMKTNQKFTDWLKNTYDNECPESFESCCPLINGPERNYYQFEGINRHFAGIDTYSERNGIVVHIGMGSRKANEPFSQDELQLYNQIIYSFGYYGP